jgi:hypothetical protein
MMSLNLPRGPCACGYGALKTWHKSVVIVITKGGDETILRVEAGNRLQVGSLVYSACLSMGE